MNNPIRLFQYFENYEIPFAVYQATGKDLCEVCLHLDRRCFETDKAIEIESGLVCECEHQWGSYGAFNDIEMNEHEVAKRELGLSSSLRPCAALCSPELYALAVEAIKQDDAYRAEQERISTLIYGPDRFSIICSGKPPLRRITHEETVMLNTARRAAARAQAAVRNCIENRVRDKHGRPHVGERWTNETALFRLVSALFPDDKVIHHYRADWLGLLELDAYVIGANIGFEYQGIQHFKAQKHWDGIAGLYRTKKRDAEKVRRCKENGTRLIKVLYTEAITEEVIRAKLESDDEEETSEKPRRRFVTISPSLATADPRERRQRN